MAKHNFANLKMTPEMVIQAISTGFRIADEDWLDVIERCCSKAVSRTDIVMLRRQLDPDAERRGKPSVRRPSKVQLIKSLERICHPDLPAVFVEYLIARLRSGRRYTRRDSDIAYNRNWLRIERNMLIRGYYNDLYNLLEGDPKTVEHPILGELEVPTGMTRRSDRAMEMTHRLLAERTYHYPPSTGTMMQIITQGSIRKRRPRT